MTYITVLTRTGEGQIKEENKSSLKDALYTAYQYKDLYPIVEVFDNTTGVIFARIELKNLTFVSSATKDFVYEAVTQVSSVYQFYLT